MKNKLFAKRNILAIGIMKVLLVREVVPEHNAECDVQNV